MDATQNPEPQFPRSSVKQGLIQEASKEAAIIPPLTRRGFLGWLSLGWITFTAAFGGFLGLLGRFLFPNVLFEPPTTFRAGFPDEFAIGQVDERFKDKYGVWLVREPKGMYALSVICTHLGCIPNWLPGEQKFKCPCHGSGYYKTGVNFEGPAPRPLERVKISLADDGQILVDKSMKFLQEKGQWNDPDSYLMI
jgi:cytochrome b6-f complex iron-sulfur subunit